MSRKFMSSHGVTSITPCGYKPQFDLMLNLNR